MEGLREGERLARIGWSYGDPGAYDGAQGAWWLAVPESWNAAQLERRLRQVALEFVRGMTREEYASQLCESCGFNWGDLFANVVIEHYDPNIRELEPPIPAVELRVDHDEVLASWDDAKEAV